MVQDEEAAFRTAVNNEFFKRQTDHFRETKAHLPCFEEEPAFAELQEAMRSAIRAYLEGHGIGSDAAAELSDGEMYLWASVHAAGSTHPPHVHSDSCVSAVFYASVDEESGAIVFDDPRGKTPFDHLVRVENQLRYGMPVAVQSPPPFHRKYQHRPRDGELVLFPPWIIHQVVPGTSHRRVSLSCNLVGPWDVLSQFGAAVHDVDHGALELSEMPR